MARRTADTALDEAALQDIVGSLGTDYRTVGDLAYSVLHRAVITGLLAPGEKLRQQELARWLGISREPVRSAILQLASDGLAVVHPHRGAVVRALSVSRIREIYEHLDSLRFFQLALDPAENLAAVRERIAGANS